MSNPNIAPSVIPIDDEIHLELFTPADVEPFFEYVTSERAHFSQWEDWATDFDHTTAERAVAAITANIPKGLTAQYKVMYRGEFGGHASLRRHDNPTRGMMGYGVRERLQGRGIMRRTLPALVEFGWQWGLEEIDLEIRQRNEASESLARLLGARRISVVSTSDTEAEGLWRLRRP